MNTSRRRFLQASAASAAGLAFGSRPITALAADKPNSVFRGVQIGTITYSYRTMPEQSAEATLRYVVDSGISAIELMGPPAEAFAGAPANPVPEFARLSFLESQNRLQGDDLAEYNEKRGIHDRYTRALREWRESTPMDAFHALRDMYADAGVSVYAFKPDAFGPGNSDAEVSYGFRAAAALGATHCTAELPADPAESLRLGRAAEEHDFYMAYHTHEQASLDAFDTAFSQSTRNLSNVDLGHYVAAPQGGDPLAFLRKHHARIASAHLKDRQTPANGAGNLPWGTGDTPLVGILQLIRDEGWRFPATIEVEYAIPEGSDAVREVARCLEFCKAALDA